MNYAILTLALLGMAGCYDIARRMTAKTRHSMRLAVVVIGLGCVAAMLNHYEGALVLLLAGCGMHQVFDRRQGDGHVATCAVCGCPDPDQPTVAGWQSQPAEETRHAVGRVVNISAGRQGVGGMR